RARAPARRRARVPGPAADRPARPRRRARRGPDPLRSPTVRDLLALPRRGLATRLGAGVLELCRRADARADEPPLPEARDARVAEAIDLEAPVERLEPLLFALRGTLARLLERLDARHLGCGDLELSLELADGGRAARRIGVAAPCRDLRVLARL